MSTTTRNVDHIIEIGLNRNVVCERDGRCVFSLPASYPVNLIAAAVYLYRLGLQRGRRQGWDQRAKRSQLGAQHEVKKQGIAA